jgi:hypothetical protein
MPVPTQDELTQRNNIAQVRLDKLRLVYDNFLKEWQKIEKQEYDLLRSIHTDVDKKNIHDILKKIEHLNN